MTPSAEINFRITIALLTVSSSELKVIKGLINYAMKKIGKHIIDKYLAT